MKVGVEEVQNLDGGGQVYGKGWEWRCWAATRVVGGYGVGVETRLVEPWTAVDEEQEVVAWQAKVRDGARRYSEVDFERAVKGR